MGVEVGLGQEDRADGDPFLARFVAGVADVFEEKVLRNLNMDAGPVAGLAVGVDGAPMPYPLQGLDAGDDDLTPRYAVDGGDQADTARAVFIRRIIEAGFGQVSGTVLPGMDELGGGFGSAAVIGHLRWSSRRVFDGALFCGDAGVGGLGLELVVDGLGGEPRVADSPDHQ